MAATFAGRVVSSARLPVEPRADVLPTASISCGSSRPSWARSPVVGSARPFSSLAPTANAGVGLSRISLKPLRFGRNCTRYCLRPSPILTSSDKRSSRPPGRSIKTCCCRFRFRPDIAVLDRPQPRFARPAVRSRPLRKPSRCLGRQHWHLRLAPGGRDTLLRVECLS